MSALNTLLIASSKTVEEITSKQIEANKESEHIKASQLLKMLTEIAPNAIASFDLSALLNYAKVATEDPDIAYVAFTSHDNKVLAQSGNKTSVDTDTTLEKSISYEGEPLGSVTVVYNHTRLTMQSNALKTASAQSLETMNVIKNDAFNTAALRLSIMIIFIVFIAMVVIYYASRSITRPLNTAVELAKQIANGDLTATVESHSNDETGRLMAAMATMQDSLKSLVRQITGATGRLADTSSQMIQITQDTSAGTEQQQSETDQLATAMNQMAATVLKVAKNAQEASNAANSANDEANNGKVVVTEATDVIDSLVDEIKTATDVVSNLQTETNNIGSVLDVIRGIAEQTNLLALNAAIEAARAGEQGRGFAVVADEVRTLASRTQTSTQEIQQMIERLQNGASQAVQTMERSQKKSELGAEKTEAAAICLATIAQSVSTIMEMNAQIASAAEEQGSVAKEVNLNVTNISEVATRTADNAQLTTNASADLAKLAGELQELVGNFRT